MGYALGVFSKRMHGFFVGQRPEVYSQMWARRARVFFVRRHPSARIVVSFRARVLRRVRTSCMLYALRHGGAYMLHLIENRMWSHLHMLPVKGEKIFCKLFHCYDFIPVGHYSWLVTMLGITFVLYSRLDLISYRTPNRSIIIHLATLSFVFSVSTLFAGL